MSKKYYLFFAVLIFGIEVLIATVLKDSFLRPVFGDYLVVLLLFCIIKAIVNIPYKTAAIIVLLTAYLIEFLQYLNILKILGIQRSRLTDIVLGSSFDWYDMLAYTLGFLTLIGVFYWAKSKNYSL